MHQAAHLLSPAGPVSVLRPSHGPDRPGPESARSRQSRGRVADDSDQDSGQGPPGSCYAWGWAMRGVARGSCHAGVWVLMGRPSPQGQRKSSCLPALQPVGSSAAGRGERQAPADPDSESGLRVGTQSRAPADPDSEGGGSKARLGDRGQTPDRQRPCRAAECCLTGHAKAKVGSGALDCWPGANTTPTYAEGSMMATT